MKEQQPIRISCAALCRIEIGGEFLLEINKNRGDVLKPIGGALEFDEEARPFLESLGAVFQKGNDLRLTLPLNQLSAFEHWFFQRKHRETNPMRELKEELVEEHMLPISKNALDGIESGYIETVVYKRQTSRKGLEGTLTRYFLEIFSVSLPEAVGKAVIEAAASLEYSRLHLVSEDGGSESLPAGSLSLAGTSRMVMRSFNPQTICGPLRAHHRPPEPPL